MKDFYPAAAWKNSKLLFAGLVLFMAGQVYFSAKRIQSFPFFTFDMYSRPYHEAEVFTLYEVFCDGRRMDYTCLTNTQEATLLSSLLNYENEIHALPASPDDVLIEHRFSKHVSPAQYAFIRDGLINNREAIDAYPGWLQRHFFPNSHVLLVERNTYRSRDRQLLQSQKILEYHAPN